MTAAGCNNNMKICIFHVLLALLLAVTSVAADDVQTCIDKGNACRDAELAYNGGNNGIDNDECDSTCADCINYCGSRVVVGVGVFPTVCAYCEHVRVLCDDAPPPPTPDPPLEEPDDPDDYYRT